MGKGRHPKKDIAKALSYAEKEGWQVTEIAKRIRKQADRCTHGKWRG